MLAFITTLRHPRNSTDYARVEQLLSDTLHSVTNQTSDDYVVIVVGNRAPAFELPDRVHFVPVDFRAPAKKGERVRRAPLIRDKGCKLGIGLVAARAFSPDHVMIFDADDFVHRDLAAFVAEHPDSPGWVVRDGWMYSRARSAYRPQPRFNKKCGTSFVMAYEAYAVPDDLTVDASRGEVKRAFGERLSKVLGSHKWAEEWFTDHGWKPEPLPFPGAVYHVDTGQNHSLNAQLTGRAKPLGRQMQAEYGILPARGPVGTLWACYCSRPVARVASVFSPLTRVLRRVVRGVRRRVRRRPAS